MPSSENPSAPEITPERMARARERIAGHVRPSPLVFSQALSDEIGRPVSLKLELLQPSGSFKVRGAYSKLLGLCDAERAAGVVAVSGGNHGLAVAAAGGALGLQVRVYLPKTAPERSVRLIRGYGAEAVLCESIGEAFERVGEAAEAGATYIHPFDDPDVVAGQAGIGLELLESGEPFTDIVGSIGGGGMFGGTAAAVKAARPEVRAWGVETVGADAMTKALAAGAPVSMEITSIATTLGAPAVSPLTLHLARSLFEDILLIEDVEAVRDLLVLIDRCKLVCEPAAACCLAAARRLAPTLPEEARLVVILCGGNVTLEEIAGWRSRFGL